MQPALSAGMHSFGRVYRWVSPTCSAGSCISIQHLRGYFGKWMCNSWCSKSRLIRQDTRSRDLWECARTIRSYRGNHPMRRRHFSQRPMIKSTYHNYIAITPNNSKTKSVGSPIQKLMIDQLAHRQSFFRIFM
jgi:hypothetical protein